MADETKPENVFLFYPNIIGYGRVALLVASMATMPHFYVITCIMYFTSQMLDAVDGHVARYMNQASRLGAMLDQLTDRCSTLCLLMVLSYFYPKFLFFFQLSSALDIASHWLHLHSSDIKGGTHYKKVEVTNTFTQILHYYYTSRSFLFFMCAFNELFYYSLYIYHFTAGPRVPLIGIGFWALIAMLSFPVALVKSAISGVHLVQAAQEVVKVDEKEREDKGQ